MREQKIDLLFDPVEHKYTDSTGREYTSVTTVIGKYKPAFDGRYWGMYVAIRDSGCKVRPDLDNQRIWIDGTYRTIDDLYRIPVVSAEVLKVIVKWGTLTEIACNRGNKIHDYLEDSINISKGDIKGTTNELITPQPLLNPATPDGIVAIKTIHDLSLTTIGETFPTVYDRLAYYIRLGCTIYAEKRIYSTYYGIAGMIDVLIVKGRQFAILDWKTNKDEMLFKSGYYKKEWLDGVYTKTSKWIDKKEYMHFPIDMVENCKGMIYSLQLSLYAYIMTLWGYKLAKDGLEIFHIREGFKPQLINVAYAEKHIKLMLEHHKENLGVKQRGITITTKPAIGFGIN